MKTFKKVVLVIVGTFFVILGVIGLLLPVIPTTPFLIVAGFCYINSSEKLYQWLIQTKYFGEHVKRYVENREVSRKFKITSILFIWIPTFITITLIVEHWLVRLFSIAFASIVTIYLLTLKTID